MNLKRGDENDNVKHVQELLALMGMVTTLDGEFGPATEMLVKRFQSLSGVPDGIVTPAVYDAMLARVGLADAMNPPLYVVKSTLHETMANLAQWHRQQRPREVGQDNHGPWVRLYMGGTEGLPWCAGFATFIMKQAAKMTGLKAPISGGWSCTNNAEQAKAAGIFHRGEDCGGGLIPLGSMFVRRKKGVANAWEHTGIVIADYPDKNVVETVEGNTNDDGAREGYEVCTHTLRRDNRDYIFM